MIRQFRQFSGSTTSRRQLPRRQPPVKPKTCRPVDLNSKVAVIVEPRPHRALRFVIDNVVENLDESWKIQVFHGTKNEAFVRRTLCDYIADGRIQLVNIGINNFPNTHLYSHYMKSPEFWSQVDGEHVLTFQTDSMFLKNPRRSLDEYLKYDYVGAPWKRNGRVGNGGFSLRRKSSSLAAARVASRTSNVPEDEYFAEYFRRHPTFVLCPVQLSKEFSVETFFYDYPIATHKCWTRGVMKPGEYKEFIRLHPEILTLLNLQKSANVVNFSNRRKGFIGNMLRRRRQIVKKHKINRISRVKRRDNVATTIKKDNQTD